MSNCVKNWKKIWLVLVIFAIIGVSSGGFLLYGPYSGFRDWLITTAMTTMTHQYFATWFYDDETIEASLAKNKVEEVNECVEATYAIDERYCNNGYMSEALKRVIKYAFEELLVNRFQTCCVVSNEASRKVMEKCGMRYEGLLRSYVILKDGYHDTYMYSIVREDLE